MSIPTADPLIRVQNLARRTKVVTLDTSYAVCCELLRVGPYPLIAVVQPVQDASDSSGALLCGTISAKAIADRLLSSSPMQQEFIRTQGTVRDFYQPAPTEDCLTPWDDIGHAMVVMNRTGHEAVPVIASRDMAVYRGMLARSDLFRDLQRPFIPPQIGGMATPLGVYLTTGTVSGGVGNLALAATGFFTLILHTAGLATLAGTGYLLHHQFPRLFQVAGMLPHGLGLVLSGTLFTLAQTGLFLFFLRLTPLAGYHAAEHQVVHAIERGEPLIPDIVRAMPRVHPRCSTNLVGGVLLFYLVGSGLSSVLGAEISYLLGAAIAFFWWRPVGAFLQQYATTRPASDREIASGIQAARDLFQAMDQPISMPESRPLSPFRSRLNRIWHAGFLQIFIGSTVALFIFYAIAHLYPPFERFFVEFIE